MYREQNGVSTDFDGNSIVKCKKGDNIAYIGYKILLLTITDKINNCFFRRRCKSLNEVVIQVGYGTVKKKRLNRCGNSFDV
jgi:hypothetical protein